LAPQAEKIEFEESVKFEANALNVNAGAGTLTLEGLPGITVVVDDAFTEFKDVANLAGVAAGNNLKIRARLSGSTGTTVVATRLELEDPNRQTRLIIQGTVESFVAFSTVTILGIDVDVTTIADDDFKDDDTNIGEAAFFSALAVGDLVKARADLDLGTGDVTWNQIEFED
jgi:hypothetical protein